MIKIDDERDTYDAKKFLKKVKDYLNWIDFKEQKEQKENMLNKLSEDNLFYSERVDSAKLMQKCSIIAIAVALILGLFSFYGKSSPTVFSFLIVGFFLICLALSTRNVISISKIIDKNCTKKTEFEKELNDLNDKINKIKINW